MRKLLRKLLRKASYDPKAWGRLDKGWDNNFGAIGWSPYRTNILDWVMEIEGDIEHTIDIGCHTGHYIMSLLERGYEKIYIGFDVTESFIDRAKENVPEKNFYYGDIMDWDSWSYFSMVQTFRASFARIAV